MSAYIIIESYSYRFTSQIILKCSLIYKIAICDEFC